MLNTAPEAAGQVGHYRLVSRLGAGGMGVVYLARSPSGRKVAVKIVHARYAEDPEFRARFRQEVAAARRVSGAFTAPVLDADPDAERPWMVTQHITGPTLSEYVRQVGPLPPADLRRLAVGLAEALRDIHRAGVVHRDLKPSNVLLADDGPKVIDFGISRPADSDLKTETGKLIGTPPFMAPEQFQRPREVGPAADVFALGSVLVHAATGRGPFDSESPYLVAYQVVYDEPDLTDVPDELTPLIRGCLAKDPGRRPSPEALVGIAQAPAYPPAQRPSRAPAYPPAQRPSRAPAYPPPAQRPSRAPAYPPPAQRPSQAPPTPPASPPSPAPPTLPAPPGPPAPRSGRRRRRQWWWVAAASTALLALLAAGGVVTERWQRQPRAAAPKASATKDVADAADVRTWEAAVPGVRGASATAARAAECAYADGALFCSDKGVAAARLDAVTGRAGWSRRSRAKPADPPVVSGGLVQVPESDGDRLAALDPRTGRTRWTKDVSEYGGYRFPAGDVTLLVAPGGRVSAVDGRTGRVRWTRSFQWPGGYRPVITFSGGVGYALSLSPDSKRTLITALSPGTGKVRWRHWFDGALLNLAGATPGGGLAVVQNDLSGMATAVVWYDPASERQTRTVLPYPVGGATRAAVSGGTVYLLGDDGALVAVGPRGLLWRLETSVSLPSEPTVAAGRRMFLGARDGRLLAVDLRDGTLIGQTAPRLEAGSHGYLGSMPKPVVAGPRIFSYTPNGTVFCTDLTRLVSPAS